MRILVANPNTSESVTERLLAVGRAAAAPGTELVGATAPRGVPYISSRIEAQIGGAVLLETLAERAAGFDAVIVAAFGDPGLGAARELLDIPVVGYAEAAMVTALMLGRRFAVVTFTTAMEPWYRECIEANGLQGRSAGVRCADRAFTSIDSVQAEMEDHLVALAGRAIVEDGADVIVLGGAPLAGLAARVRGRVPVPCVDAMVAAVKQAEALVALDPAKPTVGNYRRPAGKPSTGLAPALARRLAEG
ncbi:aspartate/glutamate racemase family protein [Prosthecodimorpha staleyi]|uniref:Aspartate/glutamate racemase family protein n=1 Tax=Prosthecodimorpha staleyi TaxID=2840188 RepID=A0A947DAH8_9HYPH|nr:aspartate/glutamate racemase family protein [Prosthecodimorpha staleyi]MBT9291612.1 aspartate/glutamate racemase family protein [Prosthecodimorpha staleyi]